VRNKARSFGDKALRFSPGQAAALRSAGAKLTVLAYHGVEDAGNFNAQLDYLGKVGTFVSLDEVIGHTRDGAGLPHRPVLVTFDDGDPTVLTVAAPELARRGIPAVAFVITGYLGTNRPFWWEEVAGLVANGDEGVPDVVRAMKRLPNEERLAAIEAMRAHDGGRRLEREQLHFEDLSRLEEAGIEVGNHTYTHPILTRCDTETINEEIDRAHQALAEHLGHPVRAFAYPNGDHDSAVAKAVGAHGHEVAFRFDHALEQLPVRDPLTISRVRVSSTTSIDRLAIIVSGLHPWIHKKAGRS